MTGRAAELSEPIPDRIRHYVLDGSDQDLRRLLSVAEVQAESARAAIRRIGDIAGWRAIECGCRPLGSEPRHRRVIRTSAPSAGTGN
jgi:hypothetical protein